MNRTKNIKFFLVFNDSFSRMLYHQYLVKLGYKNNILIESAEDCLKKLDLEPDVIFIDCELHSMNGLEALKKIKSHNPDIHVLLIGCPNKKQVLIEAMKYGATGFINKGVNDLEMLQEEVEKIASARLLKRKLEIAQ